MVKQRLYPKRQIIEDRKVMNNFFKNNPRVNQELWRKAFKTITDWTLQQNKFNTNEYNYNLYLSKYSNRRVMSNYNNEIQNYYYYLRDSYFLLHRVHKELFGYFNYNDRKKGSDGKNLYMNSIIFYHNLYFFNYINLLYSSSEKLGQFINYYLKLELPEDKLFFHTVINKLKNDKALRKRINKLETPIIYLLISFNDNNVFKTLTDNRRHVTHRLYLQGDNKFFNFKLLRQRYLLSKNSFILINKFYNDMNKAIVRTGKKICLLYK